MLIGLLLMIGAITFTEYTAADEQKSGDASAACKELRLMTFNIRTGKAKDGEHHWRYRSRYVVQLLSESAPDVLGLQEALDFQVDKIAVGLPEYAVISAGRLDGKAAGEACSIFYRKDRFRALDSGTFWFSDTPAEPGSMHWGNKYARICTWVQLFDQNTDTAFYVYNVHLDHQSQPSREKSVRLLARQIASRTGGKACIIMGDFNVELTNPAMQYLQKIGFDHPAPLLADSWQLAHPSEVPIGTYHGFTGVPASPKIDHILVTDRIRVLEADIHQRHFDGVYPSDHFPVSAVVQIIAQDK